MNIYAITQDEKLIIDKIKYETALGNQDNITRTELYDQLYIRNKELVWAYLASVVSRNAGWNMTDLEGEIFKRLIPKSYRKILFLTYERANWLIFSDAYPQLILYETSKKIGEPLFYLLKFFHVSKFMEQEWNYFWKYNDIDRLCTSLIINEQHVIQEPVIKHWFYNKKVFGSIPFTIQDYLHFSTVLFPTLDGQLFGYSVHGFTKVKNRIELGKRLAWLLFYSEECKQIREFVSNISHTGSRFDYEQFINKINRRRTPTLRDVYPIIFHERNNFEDWFIKKNPKKIKEYFEPFKPIVNYQITDWYYEKQKQLQLAVILEEKIMNLIKPTKRKV